MRTDSFVTDSQEPEGARALDMGTGDSQVDTEAKPRILAPRERASVVDARERGGVGVMRD